MTLPVPDWQLPLGVTRPLWDYIQSPQIARHYDEHLAGSGMVEADQRFAERHFDRPGRLIDLGCGTGRLLVPFAVRGYWVLGVDLSEEMLGMARAKAAQAKVTVHLLKANLVDLDGLAGKTFDYASCLFSTVGMIAGSQERQRFVEHVYRLLRPGGKFILHVHNRWFNIWNRDGRWWLFKDLVGNLFASKEGGNKTMPVHQGVAGLTLHLFTRREAVGLLRSAGFRIREVRAVGLGPQGRLRWEWWCKGLRSYGYLLAGERIA
jgi:SAM-dependent methyltransferase